MKEDEELLLTVASDAIDWYTHRAPDDYINQPLAELLLDLLDAWLDARDRAECLSGSLLRLRAYAEDKR